MESLGGCNTLRMSECREHDPVLLRPVPGFVPVWHGSKAVVGWICRDRFSPTWLVWYTAAECRDSGLDRFLRARR